jgi:hypothetical protein
VLLPTRHPAHAIPIVTQVRATTLPGSLRALEKRGLRAAYERNLPQSMQATVGQVFGAPWVDIDRALAHFLAIDGLGLPASEQAAMALEVVTPVQNALTSTIVRVSRGLGTTPWTFMPYAQRFWDRMCRGGDLSVERIGPKEVVTSMYGLPLFGSRYFRVAMRSSLQAGLMPWCIKVYVTEVSATATTAVFRQAWA